MKTTSFTLIHSFLCLLSFAHALPTDPWINADYPYRVALTNLSPAVPGGNLVDFPVLAAITNADWLVPIQDNGGDISFAGVDGQQMFHEIEFFGRNGGRSTLQAWVCVPNFTNKTTIYMYWGNHTSSLAFVGSNSTFVLSTNLPALVHPAIQTNAWDCNYVAVLHLNDAVSNGGIYAKDSSRFQTTATTPAGTNIIAGQTGIGVSAMGNYHGARLALGSTNIKFGTYGGYASGYTRGIFLDKFNNCPGVPAYDLLNHSGGGSLSASLWVRWLSAPSNQATWTGTNWGAFTNNAAIGLMAIKDANMIGDSRSYQYLMMRSSDNFGRTSARGVGNDATGTLAATNVATIGGDGMYSNWFHYAATVGSMGTTFYHTNWVNGRAVMNTSGAANSGTSSPRGVYVAGVAGDYPQGGYHHFSPNIVVDEYRLSMCVRSRAWLVNEYSNVVNTTNMALVNGAQSHLVETRPAGSISAGQSIVRQGSKLLGSLSPYDPTALLILSNVSEEIIRQAVTSEGPCRWSSILSVPTGSYMAYLIWTNFLRQNMMASAPVRVSIASTLTLKTVNPIGEPVAGARVIGPANNLGGVALYTNNLQGALVFPDMFFGSIYTFTNFAPGLFCLPAEVTNISMPNSNLTVWWVVQIPVAPQIATNSEASSRLDAKVFFQNKAPFFTLSVPAATHHAVRVVISAIKINGGRRVVIFDDTVSPYFPYAQIPSGKLKQYVTPGIWVIEMSFPSIQGDAFLTPVNRRLVFFVE